MRKLLDRLRASIADDQNARLVDEAFVWLAIAIGAFWSYIFISVLC